MKTLRFMLALFAAVAAARAESITLTDGRVFEEAKITTQTPTHVTVRHQGGLQQVPKKLLPAELAAKYPIDEVAAEKARVRAEAASRLNQDRVAALQAAAAARRASMPDDAPVVSIEERARIMAEEEMKKFFRRPDSAQFKHTKIHRPMDGWDYIEVAGRSAGKNGLNEMVWDSHRVIIKHHATGDRLELIYLEMAGTPKVGSWENKSAPPR